MKFHALSEKRKKNGTNTIPSHFVYSNIRRKEAVKKITEMCEYAEEREGKRESTCLRTDVRTT